MTDRRPTLPRQISEPGVIAIARRQSTDSLTAIADAAAGAGIRAFEVTLNEPEAQALGAIEMLAGRFDASELLVGAGTVLSVGAAEQAIGAGAAFLVMPHTDAAILAWAVQRGVPIMPGAATPTELLLGWRAGAAAVKIFPASSLGPTFLREVRGPFPDVALVPTGGITAENAGAFITAGAVAVGAGGWLIGDGGAKGIGERAAALLAAIADARAGQAARIARSA